MSPHDVVDMRHGAQWEPASTLRLDRSAVGSPIPLRSEAPARWKAVLEAASRTQSAVGEAVPVGGTAVNILVPYRSTSQDADYLVHNLASCDVR